MPKASRSFSQRTLSQAWLRSLSPRHYRWRQLLRSLTFDPDAYEALREPGSRDFVICGSPRSGTTLAAGMLYYPPSVAVVSEPWDALRLQPDELFESLRAEIARGWLRRGRLNVDALQSGGSIEWTSDGEKPVSVCFDEDFLLGVKFPAFWRYLSRFQSTKFVICIRHPVDVILSYRSAGGRLAEGLEYEVPFNQTLNETLSRATDEPRLRRVLLHDYISERLIPHLDRPEVFVIRYERWFHDPEVLMTELTGFLGCDIPLSLARIRPRLKRSMDSAEIDFVIAHCRTADRLGYKMEGYDSACCSSH